LRILVFIVAGIRRKGARWFRGNLLSYLPASIEKLLGCFKTEVPDLIAARETVSWMNGYSLDDESQKTHEENFNSRRLGREYNTNDVIASQPLS
jgi:hypothetical protein